MIPWSLVIHSPFRHASLHSNNLNLPPPPAPLTLTEIRELAEGNWQSEGEHVGQLGPREEVHKATHWTHGVPLPFLMGLVLIVGV